MPGPESALAVHAGFEWGAMLLGARLYLRGRQRVIPRQASPRGLDAVVIGCLIGAAIGNKAAFWLQYPHLWDPAAGWSQALRSGQSVVGGLLGGLAGVELAKALVGEHRSTGDAFVTPILAGLFVGRIGCFIAGLHDDTYGVATSLPWAVDFGDGIPRHPTQVYEMLFVVVLAMLLHGWRARLQVAPGLAFKLMLTAYLGWRLLVDGLKPVPFTYPPGLSGIQWACLAALVLYGPLTLRQMGQCRAAIAPGRTAASTASSAGRQIIGTRDLTAGDGP